MANKLDAVADAIVEAYMNHGKSLQSLADVYNCSVGTIRNLLISRNVRRRPKGKPRGQVAA